MGCVCFFSSYFNSKNGVKILGTGELLFGGYFNSSISRVIFTPEKEFLKLSTEVKLEDNTPYSQTADTREKTGA